MRLYQGEYDKETVYDTAPLKTAQLWQEQGAGILHIVDLDGARYGELKNLSFIKEIIKKLNINVHYGGGVRTLDDIKTVFDAGVYRVIIGTKAFTDENFLAGISGDKQLRPYLNRIIVSIDAKQAPDKSGYLVCTAGWTGQTQCTSREALKKLEDAGIGMAVVTDISRDGTLSGPNLEFLKEMLTSTSVQIIASGGISSLDDVRALKRLEYFNLFGAITGKALYEGKFKLREAIDCV